MMDGCFINGPLLHYCYEFLEMYMPAEKSIFAAVLQVRSTACTCLLCTWSYSVYSAPGHTLSTLHLVIDTHTCNIPGTTE